VTERIAHWVSDEDHALPADSYHDDDGRVWNRIDCQCGAEGGCWKTRIDGKMEIGIR
jgi:hypothetical protein